MRNIPDAWIHPLSATVTILLCVLGAAMGLARTVFKLLFGLLGLDHLVLGARPILITVVFVAVFLIQVFVARDRRRVAVVKAAALSLLALDPYAWLPAFGSAVFLLQAGLHASIDWWNHRRGTTG